MSVELKDFEINGRKLWSSGYGWQCSRGHGFESCCHILDGHFCLRLKAKDLGITWVVVALVGFFVSKTHATSLSLYFYYFFKKYFFSFVLLFSITISIYLSFYMSTYLPTYLCLPTYINIPTYLSQTYLLNFDNLPTYTNQCQPTYPYQPTYINTPTYQCRLTNTYQPMSNYHHLPTYM